MITVLSEYPTKLTYQIAEYFSPKQRPDLYIIPSLPLPPFEHNNEICRKRVQMLNDYSSFLEAVNLSVNKKTSGKPFKDSPPELLIFSNMLLLLHSSLRGSQTCNGHAERRTAYIVESCSVAEFY